jgi:hypothetical protein
MGRRQAMPYDELAEQSDLGLALDKNVFCDVGLS